MALAALNNPGWFSLLPLHLSFSAGVRLVYILPQPNPNWLIA